MIKIVIDIPMTCETNLKFRKRKNTILFCNYGITVKDYQSCKKELFEIVEH